MPSRPLDDALAPLVTRAQTGDAEAFRRLAALLGPHIRRWALVQTRRTTTADEVAQTVLIRLHHTLGRYRGDARFTTWLYRIVRNASADVLRRTSRAVGLEEAVDLPTPPADVEGALDRAHYVALIRAFFQELPTRQREVFDLVDLQGYAPTEAADLLGMDVGSARGSLFKARRTIRTRILALHPELSAGY